MRHLVSLYERFLLRFLKLAKNWSRYQPRLQFVFGCTLHFVFNIRRQLQNALPPNHFAPLTLLLDESFIHRQYPFSHSACYMRNHTVYTQFESPFASPRRHLRTKHCVQTGVTTFPSNHLSRSNKRIDDLSSSFSLSSLSSIKLSVVTYICNSSRSILTLTLFTRFSVPLHLRHWYVGPNTHCEVKMTVDVFQTRINAAWKENVVNFSWLLLFPCTLYKYLHSLVSYHHPIDFTRSMH